MQCRRARSRVCVGYTRVSSHGHGRPRFKSPSRLSREAYFLLVFGAACLAGVRFSKGRFRAGIAPVFGLSCPELVEDEAVVIIGSLDLSARAAMIGIELFHA